MTRQNTKASLFGKFDNVTSALVKPASLPLIENRDKLEEDPAVQPSSRPAVQPSSRPAVQPSSRPAVQPSSRPAVQPSSRPAEGSRRLKTFIDLFAGVGGFHLAAQANGLECVFASEIDEAARAVYENNFKMVPHGDIARIRVDAVPDHDLLCAGFPCQPFSIIGNQEGFDDARGTLFFEIARILDAKRPTAFILENVKQLVTTDKGRVFKRILETLEGLGYQVDYRVLNALDFGLPQKRERVMIIGRLDTLKGFDWPQKKSIRKPLGDILEAAPDERYFVSPRIRRARQAVHTATVRPAIWHENKGGNISSHPFSCALRAGASYNYLLVDGVRRLTPREMFRLQGFPDSFQLHEKDNQARKQAGNAVPVPMIGAVIRRLTNV